MESHPGCPRLENMQERHVISLIAFIVAECPRTAERGPATLGPADAVVSTAASHAYWQQSKCCILPSRSGRKRFWHFEKDSSTRRTTLSARQNVLFPFCFSDFPCILFVEVVPYANADTYTHTETHTHINIYFILSLPREAAAHNVSADRKHVTSMRAPSRRCQSPAGTPWLSGRCSHLLHLAIEYAKSEWVAGLRN